MRTLPLCVLGILLTGYVLRAQTGLPANPEPGKCYIRCFTEDKWRNESRTVLVRPAYMKFNVIPAEYREVEEQVVIREATTRYEIIPAVFQTVTETIQVEDPYNALTVLPATFTESVEEVVYQPAYARFEWKTAAVNCDSDDPRDCQVLCYVEYPEQKSPISTQTMQSNTATTASPKGGRTITVQKEVVVTPPQIKEIQVPAEYRIVKKRVLVKDETIDTIHVDALYQTEVVRILEEKGGMEVWTEIKCELTELTPLPIYYELNSAQLTAESRKVIDDRLYQLMVQKPLIRIEVNAHTDSRGSDDFNLDLSQRRAQSVVNYLVEKGINRSRLVARGFGETRLKNNCANGVECTEAQHAQNRRTEFRVLPN
ncbi:MAG: OmpA family protein [Saprospiraceae bacterium]|nr:OmpA family protein [Saprospiraceae bacterium]